MDIRIVILLIFGISATSWAFPKTACGSGPSHDLLIGYTQSGEQLLYSTREKMPKSGLKVKSHDVEWLANPHFVFERITRIEVLDQKHDGSGGCAFLAGGGLGQNYVKLHLKTQRGGSYDFLINIYGKMDT
uniref:Putative conserved secreted protein n=1 Tax=Panstrongylus lignarius TaxID=156445 RepID=A0A224Y006_9HEMI